jgi:hypothetical protein
MLILKEDPDITSHRLKFQNLNLQESAGPQTLKEVINPHHNLLVLDLSLLQQL